MYELLKCINSRRRKEEEHALLPTIIIMLDYLFSLIEFTRDLKRGKEILNDKNDKFVL